MKFVDDDDDDDDSNICNYFCMWPIEKRSLLVSVNSPSRIVRQKVMYAEQLLNVDQFGCGTDV